MFERQQIILFTLIFMGCTGNSYLQEATKSRADADCSEYECIMATAKVENSLRIDEDAVIEKDGVLHIAWQSILEDGKYILGVSNDASCTPLLEQIKTESNEVQLKLPNYDGPLFLCLYAQKGNSYFKAVNSGIRISLTPKESNAGTPSMDFAGIKSVNTGLGWWAYISWHPATFSDNKSRDVTYKVYLANSTNNFTTPAKTLVNLESTFLAFDPNWSSLHVRVEAIAGVGNKFGSDDIFSIQVGPNSVHPVYRISSRPPTSALDNAIPFTIDQALRPHTLEVDKFGNVYFYDHSNSYALYAVCVDQTAPGFCNGKDKGKILHVAGNGTSATPVTNSDPKQSPLFEVRGIGIDSGGNIYLADYKAALVTAICFDNSLTNACNGLTPGKLHFVAGTGVNSNGAENDIPTSLSMRKPTDVEFDSLGNMYIASYEGTNRIRVVCYDIVTAGFCNGKTLGNMYYYAGNGGGAAADGTAALTANMGNLFSMEFDTHDNLFIAELKDTGHAVRYICSDHGHAQGGLCSGKTAGAIYKLAGGSSGDSLGNELATSAKLGEVKGVTIDHLGNVWLADDAKRIRVVCVDVTTSVENYCYNRTVNYIYNFASNSVKNYADSIENLTSGTLETLVVGSMKFDRTNKRLLYGSWSYLSQIIAPSTY